MNNKMFDALEYCLQALEDGADLNSVLARYPDLATELRPILEASIAARGMKIPEPSPEGMRRGRAQLLQRAAELRETKAAPRPRVIPVFQRLSLALTLAAVFLLSGTGLVRGECSFLRLFVPALEQRTHRRPQRRPPQVSRIPQRFDEPAEGEDLGVHGGVGYSRAVARKPFHNPFGELKKRLRPQEQSAPSLAIASPAALPSPAPNPAPPPTEADLWAQATAGVSRIDPGAGLAAPPGPPPAAGSYWHPDFEAIDQLRALVRGEAPFDLADSDEFIEGRAAGLDPAVARKLRRGDYAVQGHIDLHGLTRGEAKQAVDRFLKAARAEGKRCVLVVHGRGMHSRDQVPVLKEALRTWLATARFGRHVLAFATARPQDGGAGALYVLLRRAGR